MNPLATKFLPVILVVTLVSIIFFLRSNYYSLSSSATTSLRFTSHPTFPPSCPTAINGSNSNATTSLRLTSTSASHPTSLLSPCPSAINGKSIFLIILSALKNKARRQALRATWLKWTSVYPQVTYKFFVDKPESEEEIMDYHEENAIYGDLHHLSIPAFFGRFGERNWEAYHIAYSCYPTKYDYYTRCDDDSFFCLPHILSDSTSWPGSDIVLSHYRDAISDVFAFVGRTAVEKCLAAVTADPAKRALWIDDVARDVNTPMYNDIRFMFGTPSLKEGATKRENDWQNGWAGAQLMTSQEKISMCKKYMATHQAYPDVTIDLWNYLEKEKNYCDFGAPEWSNDLYKDKHEGY